MKNACDAEIQQRVGLNVKCKERDSIGEDEPSTEVWRGRRPGAAGARCSPQWIRRAGTAWYTAWCARVSGT